MKPKGIIYVYLRKVSKGTDVYKRQDTGKALSLWA